MEYNVENKPWLRIKWSIRHFLTAAAWHHWYINDAGYCDTM